MVWERSSVRREVSGGGSLWSRARGFLAAGYLAGVLVSCGEPSEAPVDPGGERVGCSESVLVPDRPSLVLAEEYGLSSDLGEALGVFDAGCEVEVHDGVVYSVDGRVVPEGEVDASRVLVGESGDRLISWLGGDRVQEHFGLEQLVSIPERFGVEGVYRDDFVNAVMFYFDRAVKFGLEGNITAQGVRGTRPFFDDPVWFPVRFHQTPGSPFEGGGPLRTYTPMDYNARALREVPREDHVPVNFFVREFADVPEMDGCRYNVEGVPVPSEVMGIDRYYVWDELDGNLEVYNPFFADAEVLLRHRAEVPGWGGWEDMSMILAPVGPISRSLYGADEIEFFVAHVSGRDGDMDDPWLPDEGDVVPYNSTFATLNPAYAEVGARFVFDYHFILSADAETDGFEVEGPPGGRYSGWQVLSHLEERRDDVTTVIGVNDPRHNYFAEVDGVVELGNYDTMQRAIVGPCTPNIHYPRPPGYTEAAGKTSALSVAGDLSARVYDWRVSGRAVASVMAQELYEAMRERMERY